MPSHKLDPNVKPFPAYVPSPIAPPHSSPTITSYSSSSAGLAVSPSQTVDSGAFPHAVLVPPTPTPVKSFGHGWNSSSTLALKRDTHTQSVSIPMLDPSSPVIVPSRSHARARSPSAPAPAPARLAHARVDSYKPTSKGSVPFPTTEPRRITSAYRLAHHSSVPSLIEDVPSANTTITTGGRGQDVSEWRQGVSPGLSVAVEEEDGYTLPPHTTALMPSRSVPVLARPTLPNDYTQSRNIYIPSLPSHFREADLENLANQFGRIIKFRLEVSPSFPSASSRAFVMFHEVEAAHKFYMHLKRNGCPCEIAKEDYATVHKSLEDPTSSNLYIQGFLPEDSMDFCREVLHPGVIISYSRPTDAQGRPRGILMARLESRAQAEDAIVRLNDRFVHPITGNKLQVRIADSDAQKKYKRESDLNRSDKFSSMPDMRHAPATPKVLTFNYRDGNVQPVSRETSYASLRTPTSAHFGPGASPAQVQISRHKPSNVSIGTGPGTDWSSRIGGFGFWPEIDESTVQF